MEDEFFTRIEGIIFDLDGLLLDTEKTYFKAWQQAACDMGWTLHGEYCQTLSGLSFVNVKRKLQEYCPDTFDDELFSRLSTQHWEDNLLIDGIDVKPGFFPLLEFVQQKQWRYTIATNSPREYARRCLQQAGIGDYFLQWISRDDVDEGKPAPDIFIQTGKTLGLALKHCLILEDSPVGIRAASQTSAKTVYIPSSTVPDADSMQMADIYCADMGALLAYLNTMDHV